MSKRVLTILLAAVLAVGIFGTVASAGVEGDFTFDFVITPQTTNYQVDKFDFNFEGILNLDITLSGLTMSNFVAFGIAGLETYVMDLETTLGALDLADEFWFSVPYGGPNLCDAVFTWNCDPRLADSLYFVKKRVALDITIGGLTMDTLIVFEDVMFEYPYVRLYDGGTGLYSLVDPVYRFGIEFGLSGTTVSGIGIEAITGISLDSQVKNSIKKYSAYGAYVGKAYTGDIGLGNAWTITPAWPATGHNLYNATLFAFAPAAFRGPVIPKTLSFSATCVQGGATLVAGTDYSISVVGIDVVSGTIAPTVKFTELKDLTTGGPIICGLWKVTGKTAPQFPEFAVEKILITDIDIAGVVTLDFSIEFRPAAPITFTTTISTVLLGIVDLVIEGETTDITTVPAFDSLTISGAMGDYITFEWADDGDFVLDAGDTITVTATIAIQTATLSATIESVPTVGLSAVEYGISIPVAIGTFDASVEYAGTPLAWDTFTFGLSSDIAGLGYDMSAEFGISGLNELDISITVPFSA